VSAVAQEARTTPLGPACATPHACPRPVRLQVLARVPFFRALDADEIAAVDRRMHVHGYAEGEPIYRAGEEATHLFVLASGRAKLVRPSPDGQDVLVDVVTPGGLFGSLSALGDVVYPDSAEALTVSCALGISAEDFRAVLHQHAEVALAVLDDVALRLEQAHRSVRRLSVDTVEQRVAATLLALADKLGEARGDAVLLQVPLTRADLASMTGTTTESVSRVMSRLRRDGIVDSGRRWTSVTDRARLAELAGG